MRNTGWYPQFINSQEEGGSGCHLWLYSLPPRDVSYQVSLKKSKVRLNAAPQSSSWLSTSCPFWAGDIRVTFNPGLFRMSWHPFFHECTWTSKSIPIVTAIHGAATRRVLEEVVFHLFNSSSTACPFPAWTCPTPKLVCPALWSPCNIHKTISHVAFQALTETFLISVFLIWLLQI